MVRHWHWLSQTLRKALWLENTEVFTLSATSDALYVCIGSKCKVSTYLSFSIYLHLDLLEVHIPPLQRKASFVLTPRYLTSVELLTSWELLRSQESRCEWVLTLRPENDDGLKGEQTSSDVFFLHVKFFTSTSTCLEILCKIHHQVGGGGGLPAVILY